jgi:RNA polymerase sigma-70 factor (ECF subfamily)
VEAHFASAYRFAFCISLAHERAADLTEQLFSEARATRLVENGTLDRRWMLATLYRNSSREAGCASELEQAKRPSVAEEALLTAARAEDFDQATILTIVHAMPSRLRLVLSLFYFEQLSYRDIARVLALPDATTISCLAEAKTLLRHQLLEQHNQNGPLQSPHAVKAKGGPGG